MNVNVGDLINVDVHKPEHGKFPIGRYNGIICKLFLPDNIKYLEYGCTVSAIVAIKEKRFLSVQVVEVVRSAAYNNSEAEKAIMKLREVSKKGSIRLA